MEKTIDINGQKLHYEQTGQGRPLILMHGWGCDLSTVRSIARTAALTHTVYNLDMPGFGQSPAPRDVWGVDDYTRMVEDFMRQEHICNPVLVGHSFGGRVAILLASRNADVDSVILVDAAGIKPHRSIGYYWKVYSFKTLKALAGALLPRRMADRVVDAMRKSRGSADYASASPVMRTIMSKVVNEDLTVRLPLIKAPTLLIWGKDDTATPIADAEKMERMIPDAALVAFDGCGHYSFLDNPGQFAAVLASFLGSRASSSTEK